jgi:DNA-binding transcriptional LysR family regulator
MALRSFREVELFAAVYEQRSFTAAARARNATQPGVSRYVSQLEKELGVPLFQRSSNHVTPTPAGHDFYRRCLELLRSREAAVQVVEAYKPGLQGEAVAGFIRSAMRSLVPPALLRFLRTNPNVNLRVYEGYSRDLVRQVAEGRLDFAIVPALADTMELPSRPFLRVPEVLVTGHPTKSKVTKVDLRTLSNLRLVIPGHENVRHAYIAAYLRAIGVSVERMLEIDTMTGTLGVVKGSEWATILPLIAMSKEDRKDFTIRWISRPPLLFDLIVVEPPGRHLSLAAEELLRVLVDHARTQFAVYKL